MAQFTLICANPAAQYSEENENVDVKSTEDHYGQN